MCTNEIKNFEFIAFGRAGQSMVELLIAIGLAAVLLPAILTGLISAKEGKAQQIQKTQAVPLLTEAQETLRSVREQGWNSFPSNGTYHPERSGNTWTLAANAETVNTYFTRKIEIFDAYRDVTGKIVFIGGAIDPSTKRVVSTVSWTTPSNFSISSTLFVTRSLQNLSYIETTQAQFNAGTKTNVAITNTSGGEITLGAGGGSDWCVPESEQIPPLDLPKNGVANAISGIQGTLFVGTGENASGVSFAKVNVSNTHPPIATLAETFDGYKTNNVFGDSNYAYLATDNNAKEVVIIDLNNIVAGKYTEAGHVDIPGPRSGNAVSVVGTTGYVTSGAKLYSFDLSNMAVCNTSGCPLIDTDGLNLAGTGNAMQIIGGYAYIAEGIATTPMQIIDISSPTNLQVVGNLASVNDKWGVDLFVNSTGTRAYLVTAQSPTLKEFFIINTTTKTNPTPVVGGSYETGGTNPKGLVIVPGNRAIIVGQGGVQDYQVVNIDDENNPYNCGGMRTFVGINDVAALVTQDGYAYAYILVLENPEFHIVEGGPGGIYGLAGTFESQTFDAGSSVAFNSFIKTLATPPSTNATFQFAVADPNPVTGDCTGVTFTYVDPTGSTIPVDDNATGYENPARCFRYKVNLSSSDPTQSPVLYDISINYSL